MGDGWGSWDSHSRPRKFSRHPQHPGSLHFTVPSWEKTLHFTVPSWEKTFCTSVCSIPWGRILVAKASLSAYKSIAEWDDTSALEAFQNAKARDWAAITGLPCDIPLPDADLYIERVDHDAVIDPKLVEDLEKPPPPVPFQNDDTNYSSDPFNIANKPIKITGWGCVEDGKSDEHHSVNWDHFIEKTVSSHGWGNAHLPESNAWSCNGGWGDATAYDCSGRGGENNNSLWNNEKGGTTSGQLWNDSNNEQERRNSRKRKGGQYDSSFSKPRHKVYEYQGANYSWNAYAEIKSADDHYEKTIRGGQPMAMRQSKSRRYCGPGNHQSSDGSVGKRYWEKV